MEGINRLIIMISPLIEAIPEAESVLFLGANFLFWWSMNIIQFLFNEALFLKLKGLEFF